LKSAVSRKERTKSMNLLIRLLSKTRLLKGDLDNHLVRASMVRHIILTTIMLIVPLALQAASKDSAKVTFDESVTVGGTEIPAGDYRVRWEATGTSVAVTITKDNKVVASAPATLIEGRTQYDEAVALKRQGNTTSVRFISWKTRSLYFDQADGSSGSTSVSGASK
jgi:hypothetical protein